MLSGDDRFNQRYRRRRSLGSGAMGEVWLADDLLLGRLVAIKTIQPVSAGAFGTDAIGRMLREARVAARLNHPNAVSVFDLSIVSGRPHVVMEYVDGESLAERLSRVSVLTPADAARLFAQIAAALATAHAMGIVHRDVKPANIMLASDGVAKLADFGIARIAGDSTLTQSGMVIGTPAYLAPEVARGGEATAAADVWALGVTLYATVEGSTPFARPGDNTLATLARVMHQGPEPPRAAGALTPLLMRMLDPAAASRPSAAQVQEVLARHAASQSDAGAMTQVRTATVEPPTRQRRTARETAKTQRFVSATPPSARTRAPGVVVAMITGIAAVLAGVFAVVVLTQQGSGATSNGAAPDLTRAAAPLTAAVPRPVSVPGTNAGSSRVSAAAASTVTNSTSSAGNSATTIEHATARPPLVATSKQMISFVDRYYRLLPNNLSQAWALLGPDLHEQGYESYVDWWSRFDSVHVTSLGADPARGTVTIKLAARLAAGGQVRTDTEELSLIVSSDGRRLLIDGSRTVS